MRNQNTNILKATIKDIIVAFICIAIIFFTIYIAWGSEISLAISLVNKISIDTSKKVLEEVKLNSVTNKLESYPEYGTKYGTIKIDAINAEEDKFVNDEVLKKVKEIKDEIKCGATFEENSLEDILVKVADLIMEEKKLRSALNKEKKDLH